MVPYDDPISGGGWLTLFAQIGPNAERVERGQKVEMSFVVGKKVHMSIPRYSTSKTILNT